MNRIEWKKDQAARKAELKTMAKQIKELKPLFKQSQRDHSLCLDDYNEQRGMKYTTVQRTPALLSIVKNVYIKALYKMWEQQTALLSLRQSYRHNHIIYCMWNGTPIEEIEPNHNEGDYHWSIIKQTEEYKRARNAQIAYDAEKIRTQAAIKADPDYEKGLFFECEVV